MSANAKLRALQLQALARRLATQPEPVRAILQAKVDAGMAELAGQDESVQAAVRGCPAARVVWPRARPGSDELASVGRFRRVWSRTRAQDSVLRAIAQRPANAGPLNSHALMLQSLDLMGTLSGEYLQRFLAQAEALLWLEAAAAQATPTPARRAKRAGGARRDRGD